MRSKKKMKTYLNNLSDVDQLFAKKLEEVDKSQYLAESILSARYEFDFSKLGEVRANQRAKLMEVIRSKVKPTVVKKKKGKRGKKDDLSTYDITLNLLESGMAIEAVAKERGLAIGTIESHLAHAVAANRISIFKFVREEDVETISIAIKEMNEGFTFKDLHLKLDGKYGYGVLRAVINHCQIVELHESGE